MKFTTEEVRNPITNEFIGTRYTIKPEGFSNILNGKRYLICKRRGCDFHNDSSVAKSDIGNYRVLTCFLDKHEEIIYGDFMRGNRWRTHSLRKNKDGICPKLKKSVLVDEMALVADLERDGWSMDGSEWGCWGVGFGPRYGIEYGELDFTKAGILEFVNRAGMVHYDKVVIANYPKYRDLGFREQQILDNLVRMEVVQDDETYLVVRFYDGEGNSFDVEQNSLRIVG